MSINFIDGPNNGFKIDNPNAPAIVKQLGAGELKTMLDRGEITLFDVRPENERAIARIAAAVLTREATCRPIQPIFKALLSMPYARPSSGRFPIRAPK